MTQEKYRCIIVGYGHMGSKIAEVLGQIGHTPILVDPKFACERITGSYPSVASVPQSLCGYPTAWFICTPTKTHLSVCREIIQRFSYVRLMVEKPLCTSNDIGGFSTAEIAARSVDIWVDNHYEDCVNLLQARQHVLNHPSQIKNLVIEFSKNRTDDITNGRYVDNDFMLWGYEGFHMVYIASQLLAAADAEAFINHEGTYSYILGPDGHVSWITEKAVLPSGTTILLRTATDGSIFSGTNGNSILIGKQRKRRVEGTFNDGSTITLRFAEAKDIEFAPSDQYSFGWQGSGGASEHGVRWTSDNPLKSHVTRFLQGGPDSISTFDLGLKLTRRLSKMAMQSYHNGHLTLCDMKFKGLK